MYGGVVAMAATQSSMVTLGLYERPDLDRLEPRNALQGLERVEGSQSRISVKAVQRERERETKEGRKGKSVRVCL